MDFSDTFAKHVTKAGIVPTFHLPYPAFTTIYFLVFVAMISILLMNLLTGVALDNVNGVQDSAVIERLAMQAKLSLDFEFVVPKNWQKKWIEQSFGDLIKKEKPNQDNTLIGDVVRDNGTLRRIAKKVVEKETDVGCIKIKMLLKFSLVLISLPE